MPAQLLVANPLNRYLITRRLPNLKLDADGGLTLLIQNESPARTRKLIGCPRQGAFLMALRLYGRRKKRWKAIGSRRP